MKSPNGRNGRRELRENDHNRLADAQSAIIELDRLRGGPRSGCMAGQHRRCMVHCMSSLWPGP
jgi:hypothetical protein